MKFNFTARIYKVGINPCVKVPLSITAKMRPTKGYIPIKGKMDKHPFRQTMVPVKNEEYRLYVNGPMLKGTDRKVGDIVHFAIEQDFTSASKAFPMNKKFKKELENSSLMQAFKKLVPSRQKEILRYLNYLKTEEALKRNMKKVIDGLKNT